MKKTKPTFFERLIRLIAIGLSIGMVLVFSPEDLIRGASG